MSDMEMISPKKKSLLLSDGEHKVDLVLVYQENQDLRDNEREDMKRLNREQFLKNLRLRGLKLKEEIYSQNPSTHFIKIHASFEILCYGAQELKMKMPIPSKIKMPITDNIEILPWFWRAFQSLIHCFQKRNIQRWSQELRTVMTPFDVDRLKGFLSQEHQDTFFSSSERSKIVYHLLQKTKFGNEDFNFGIQNLLHEGSFSAAYPLHEEGLKDKSQSTPANDRQKLQYIWARWKGMLKYQPLEHIKKYFGEMVAIYFAWLGFYTSFLIPAAIVGFFCFIYGVSIANNYIPVKETCYPKNESLLYMCPLCDKICSYYLLSNTACTYARVTTFFDNGATVFFAFFMSLWAATFLEFWKRKEVSLAYKWHTMHFELEDEQPRPEYIASTQKQNIRMLEPYLPSTIRIPRLLASFSTVLFFILLVVASVTGVIVYRASLFAILLSQKRQQIRSHAKMVVSVTAALINLIVINLLKFVYQKVAIRLTNWENPRTHTDYVDSFTVKMFWFQFVNTYSSVFYIAFFKNEYFVGWPGNYKRSGATSYRLEGCSEQGCFLELCVQLITIMVCQQLFGNVSEIAIPMLHNYFGRKKLKKDSELDPPRWEQDYQLKEQDGLFLFSHYLELVLQYGFVTMFVAAFPLAPVFALINNAIEIRLDAINFITYFRRPISQRAENIGSWFGILHIVTQVAVVVNALVLAFTSDFIPRMVYTYVYSPDGTLNGYVNNSLSIFYIKDYLNTSKPDNATANVPYTMPFCRYPGHHEDNYPYGFDKQYWVILSARLAFVCLFIFSVGILRIGIAWVVPDIPKEIELKIRLQNYLVDKVLKDHHSVIGKATFVRDEAPDSEETEENYRPLLS